MIKVFIWWGVMFIMLGLTVAIMETGSMIPVFIFAVLWLFLVFGLRCANCGLPIWIEHQKKYSGFPMLRFPNERCSRCGKLVDSKSH
jgi:DNA-directed RNA polymerase subunit RPC12/RpoP